MLHAVTFLFKLKRYFRPETDGYHFFKTDIDIFKKFFTVIWPVANSGPVSSGFSAESSALVYGLEWCHSHLKTCRFRSALALLSSASAFLRPESFWDIWGFSDSLSSRVALGFRWVPGHAGLPSDRRADSLAGTGAALPVARVPCPPGSDYCRNWARSLLFVETTLSYNSLPCQIPSVSSEELALSRLIRCKLSRLRCHGHSLLLSSCLCRMERKENSSCSACRHPLQDPTHLLLDCPGSEPLRRAIFGTTSSIFDLGAWLDCWVSVEFLYAPIPRKGSGSTTTIFQNLLPIYLPIF